MSAPKGDKPLFTPGPLTTSAAVKEAMLHDFGSRDGTFLRIVKEIREELLRLAGTSQADGYEAVLLQGSGTFGLESVVGSAVPSDGGLLVIANGAYGERLVQIAKVLRIPVDQLAWAPDRMPDPAVVARRLEERSDLTHVAVVHCETTAGIMNPLAEIAEAVKAQERRFIVDAMSSFGALPVDLDAWGVDFLISSANKCIEGVPGFTFILASRDALRECEGRARSLSLDLHAQWKGLESNGQFRFTPPTHVLLAFRQALRELEAEGGPEGRLARYRRTQRRVVEGMGKLGFRPYLDPKVQGPIITSFAYPDDPRFRFDEFYEALNDRGFVIYPGKVADVSCFRIGSIGRLSADQVEGLLTAVGEVVESAGIIMLG